MPPEPTLDSVSNVEALLQRWLQASPELGTLVERYGSPAPALRHLGLQLWQAQKLEAAAEAFSAALTLSPHDATLWLDHALMADALGRPDSARDAALRSIELDAQQPRSWLLLGGLDSRRGDKAAAASSYRAAVALDPGLGDAHFGLGLIAFEARRFLEATESFRRALAHGYDNALGRTCLAHGLYAIGAFAECAATFESAAALAPLDGKARVKFARARTFEAMIGGDIDGALARYPDLAGDEREDIDVVVREAFSILSAYGHRTAAIAVGRWRLARQPDDLVQRYLLDAVEGTALNRAPVDYVEHYFDRFAADFDEKLVDVLLYDVPRRLAALVARHRTVCPAVLDLGCGTGLSGPHLAPFTAELTGVDLSGNMLAQAGKRGCYGTLVKAEAVQYLAQHANGFDLIFAADVLIYFGDLKPVFEAAKVALKSGGLFAFSLETSAAGAYTILSSGRFAHAIESVVGLLAPDFRVLERTPATIRLEAADPVQGVLVVAEQL